ncbi:hypothetical protein AB7Z57_14990 [Providencia alcalifaciens]|uniref:hypothetical protein n=1 Tax=Providencia sp. PROV137 TaxID=2949847 RepID=UPI0023497975|nr:hypothetical protein [Providencia sp. PROV137]ELR5109041.1 hypothetical protein [Providencia rettgeri]
MNLKNKNIYLISPRFFNYENDIIQEIKKFGANVKYYDERPFQSILGKALLRFNIRPLIQKRINSYFERNIIKNAHNIDYLLIINPESIPSYVLSQLKKINKNIRIIIYMWDSFANKKSAIKLIPYSDRFFTFDPNDAKKYSLELLPLFFTSEYSNINTVNNFQFDACFIGTAHSQRFDIAKKITLGLDKSYLFFYTPSIFVFFYKKIILRELKGLTISNISTKKMSKESIIDIINHSKSIIDISHPSQVGLTMRTFETIGAKRKLITTNSEIEKYDFYHKNNIFCLSEGTTQDELNEFLSLPYVDTLEHLYEKYKLSNWVSSLFK